MALGADQALQSLLRVTQQISQGHAGHGSFSSSVLRALSQLLILQYAERKDGYHCE